MKSWPGGAPGEEQESHLRRSCAVVERAPGKASSHHVTIRQPTLVVAWVGMDRHASEHKRHPVFRRRVPALNMAAEADDHRCLGG